MLEMLLVNKRSNSTPPVSGSLVLFMGGSVYLNTTERYAQETDTTLSGGNLAGGRRLGAAVSNIDYGLYAGGQISGASWSTVAESYRWSTDTASTLTALQTARSNPCAFGNETTAVITGGITSAANGTTDTRKYAYASFTQTPGTAMQSALYDGAGAACSSYGVRLGGVVSGGGVNRTTNTYTFADNTTGSGSLLPVAQYNTPASASSASDAYIFGGNYSGATYSSQRFSYASKTTVATTGLASGTRRFGGGAGNGTKAVIGGGQSMETSVEIFTMPTDTVVGGTSLATARYQTSACCSVPGGLSY